MSDVRVISFELALYDAQYPAQVRTDKEGKIKAIVERCEMAEGFVNRVDYIVTIKFQSPTMDIRLSTESIIRMAELLKEYAREE